MANDDAPLSAEERAELEELRAQKAAAQERARARAERQELERLRQERAAAQPSASEERARKLMEPGDDLSMPVAQKIVLAAIALIVIAVVAMYFFGPK